MALALINAMRSQWQKIQYGSPNAVADWFCELSQFGRCINLVITISVDAHSTLTALKAVRCR